MQSSGATNKHKAKTSNLKKKTIQRGWKLGKKIKFKTLLTHFVTFNCNFSTAK